MVNQRIKTFWEKEIDDLIDAYSVQPDEADWLDKLKALRKWTEIGNYAKGICRNIYTKAGQPVPTVIPAANKNYSVLLANSFKDLELEWLDLVTVYRNKIGVDPEDNTTVVVNGNPVPKWKNDINQKLPNQQTKLTDIPNNLDLVDLLYRNDMYQQITNNTTGLDDIMERGLIGNDRPFVYGYRWPFKVDTVNLNNYKNAKTEIINIANQLGTLFAPDAVPNDWDTQLVKKSDLDTANATIATLTTKSNEYDRIHTKLNGQVSDTELDTLLSNSPQCSHADYDTIKQERDQLKTDKDNHKCDCDSKVAQKETEILTKIITDCGLATERERENLLEAVITEIKQKINPPTDSKDQKITELETKITNLQSPKSLNDLPISSAVKEEMIKISQELGCTSQACAKLETAASYSELSSLQKEAFQEKLNSEISSKKLAHYLNYGLGALTIGSLLILAYLLMKGIKISLPGGGDKKAKE